MFHSSSTVSCFTVARSSSSSSSSSGVKSFFTSGSHGLMFHGGSSIIRVLLFLSRRSYPLMTRGVCDLVAKFLIFLVHGGITQEGGMYSRTKARIILRMHWQNEGGRYATFCGHR